VLALGPGVVVVKRGARGAWMQRRDGAPVETAAAPVRARKVLFSFNGGKDCTAVLFLLAAAVPIADLRAHCACTCAQRIARVSCQKRVSRSIDREH
jgi:hypothetical protein